MIFPTISVSFTIVYDSGRQMTCPLIEMSETFAVFIKSSAVTFKPTSPAFVTPYFTQIGPKICTIKVVAVIMSMICGPIESGKSFPAAIERPIATPAWLKRQYGRYFRTLSGAPVNLAPKRLPIVFPSVRPPTYKSAITAMKGVTIQMLSFAPTVTKNST